MYFISSGHSPTFGKWDQRFLELAFHVASWSKDPSTKVGACIVDSKRKVLGLGYNGFARGVGDSEERYNDRPTKYRLVVHAEANAILNAIASVENATLYVTLPPCHECAKLVIQAGIKRVIAPVSDLSRWQESFNTTEMMFREARVAFQLVEFEMSQGQQLCEVEGCTHTHTHEEKEHGQTV